MKHRSPLPRLSRLLRKLTPDQWDALTDRIAAEITPDDVARSFGTQPKRATNPGDRFEKALAKEGKVRSTTTISLNGNLLEAGRREARSKGRSFSHHLETMIEAKLNL